MEEHSEIVNSERMEGCLPARFSWRRLLHFAGPSLVMSAAFVDPGNLEGDLQVGVVAKYSLLWLMFTSTVLAFIIQMLAAKLGVVTDRHLAQVCREEYPWLPRYLLWLMMELAIIGSDIQEVIGSAIAINLLTGGFVPLWWGAILTAFTSFLLLYLSSLGPRVLEGFFGLLITTMTISFVVLYYVADVPAEEVLKGFIPTIPKGTMTAAVGLVGALIMPHNIYLHSAVVLSRDVNRSSAASIREAMFYFGVEVAFTLMITVVINLCIISVFASAFSGSAFEDIGLMNAGRYLGNTFGPEMVYVWALGLIGSGQSSVMAGGYAGQYVMDGFLNLQVPLWQRLLVSRSIAIVPTLIVAVMYKAAWQLDVLNQWLNVVQAIQIPFALIPVLVLTGSKRIMGKFANSMPTNIVCWTAGLTILGINFSSVFQDVVKEYVQMPLVLSMGGTALTALYISFVLYLIAEPFLPRRDGDSKREFLPTSSPLSEDAARIEEREPLIPRERDSEEVDEQ